MTIEIDVDKLNEVRACLDKVYCLLGFDVRIVPVHYVAMTREELATAAGISPRTLYKWMKSSPAREMLDEMGIDKHTKLLTPRAVEYLCSQFGITIGKL